MQLSTTYLGLELSNPLIAGASPLTGDFDAARRLDPAWYAKVLAAWDEEVHYKPKYFWIAWRAALNKAPQHALLAAKLASERFPDDPAFTDEYAYMRQVLEPKKAGDTANP